MPLFANFKKNSVHGAQSSLNLLKIEGVYQSSQTRLPCQWLKVVYEMFEGLI